MGGNHSFSDAITEWRVGGGGTLGGPVTMAEGFPEDVTARLLNIQRGGENVPKSLVGFKGGGETPCKCKQCQGA